MKVTSSFRSCRCHHKCCHY